MNNLASTIFAIAVTASLFAVTGCEGGFSASKQEVATPIAEPTPAPSADSQTLAVTGENDDGEVWAGYAPGSQLLFDGETNASDVSIGYAGSDPVYSFVRFQLTKAIPAGAIVSNANITLYGFGDYQWDDTGKLMVTANDSANAPAMSIYEDTIGASGGNLPTAAVVSWPAAGGLVWDRAGLNVSPNLKSIVQELVDKYGGIAAGASIQFWLYAPASVGDQEVIYADFGSVNHATALQIDWSK